MDVLVRPDLAAGAAETRDTPAYLSGFGNGFETEALHGTLPIGLGERRGVVVPSA